MINIGNEHFQDSEKHQIVGKIMDRSCTTMRDIITEIVDLKEKWEKDITDNPLYELNMLELVASVMGNVVVNILGSISVNNRDDKIEQLELFDRLHTAIFKNSKMAFYDFQKYPPRKEK
jgi:hypothetical protein